MVRSYVEGIGMVNPTTDLLVTSASISHDITTDNVNIGTYVAGGSIGVGWLLDRFLFAADDGARVAGGAAPNNVVVNR